MRHAVVRGVQHTYVDLVVVHERLGNEAQPGMDLQRGGEGQEAKLGGSCSGDVKMAEWDGLGFGLG